MTTSTIDVEHLFNLNVTLGDASNALIRGGPSGTRFIVPVSGGTFEGPKIKGTVALPGGDWVQARKDRTVRLDVRLLLVTDDGESILTTYHGVGTPNEDGSTDLRTAPTFETGSEKYAWLNNVQAIAIGNSTPTDVTYEVYRVL